MFIVNTLNLLFLFLMNFSDFSDTNLWWNLFSHTERHTQQPNIIYQCYRSVTMPTALRLHFSMAALDKPSNSCWHIWPTNSCTVELFTCLMFHFTETTQSALCSTLLVYVDMHPVTWVKKHTDQDPLKVTMLKKHTLDCTTSLSLQRI